MARHNVEIYKEYVPEIYLQVHKVCQIYYVFETFYAHLDRKEKGDMVKSTEKKDIYLPIVL